MWGQRRHRSSPDTRASAWSGWCSPSTPRYRIRWRLSITWSHSHPSPPERQTNMSIVIITGGSRGIGAATALASAEHGMGVILTYNSNPDSANDVVDTIVKGGGRAVALKLDVADSSSFPAFGEAVRTVLQQTWDRADFDHLVN